MNPMSNLSLFSKREKPNQQKKRRYNPIEELARKNLRLLKILMIIMKKFKTFLVISQAKSRAKLVKVKLMIQYKALEKGQYQGPLIGKRSVSSLYSNHQT